MSCTPAFVVSITSRRGAASRPSFTCPISFRTSAILLKTTSRPIPPSRPPACTAACRPPRSASGLSNAKATPTSNYHVCRPSGPSSTSWASASARSSRAAPKKSEGNRCHLWQLAGDASAGCWPRGHAAAVPGRQGARPDRPVLPRRQEPPWHPGGRPRLQTLGKADPVRHLLARPEGIEPVFHLLEGDERLHRRSPRSVVAGESATLPHRASLAAGLGQR